VHLESTKAIVVCAKYRDKIHERFNQPSPLEGYFSRRIDSPYDELSYAEYFSLFQTTKREQKDPYQCLRANHIIPRSKSAFDILKMFASRTENDSA
jgi:hypothetical protein